MFGALAPLLHSYGSSMATGNPDPAAGGADFVPEAYPVTPSASPRNRTPEPSGSLARLSPAFLPKVCVQPMALPQIHPTRAWQKVGAKPWRPVQEPLPLVAAALRWRSLA